MTCIGELVLRGERRRPAWVGLPGISRGDLIQDGEARGSANARGVLGVSSPRDETFAAPEPAIHAGRMRSNPHKSCRTGLPSMAPARECGRTIVHLGNTQKRQGFSGVPIAASCDGRLFPQSDRRCRWKRDGRPSTCDLYKYRWKVAPKPQATATSLFFVPSCLRAFSVKSIALVRVDVHPFRGHNPADNCRGCERAPLTAVTTGGRAVAQHKDMSRGNLRAGLNAMR